MNNYDSLVFENIKKEINRQKNTLNLIASENIMPVSILKATGSVLMNKYSEGYPFKKYYSGNKFVNEIERIAIEKGKELFGVDHMNVQVHSGSTANMAAYFALTDWLKKGNKILSMALDQGGHLSHGSKVNFSGKLFDVDFYSVSKKTHQLDYGEIEKKALEFKPDIIVSGASAYPRKINFKKFQEIAHKVGAYHVADIAHIAGLVAAKKHQSPVEFADIITGTTQKTLKGPRGGFIGCKEEFAKKIDKVVFPGLQGGPLENIIAAKAICFENALKPEFQSYQEQVIKNASVLANVFLDNGLDVISMGTDNHLVIVNVLSLGLTGDSATKLLEDVFINVNKNMIPYDKRNPQDPSGIRLGTPALTSRGVKEDDMEIIAQMIVDVLKNKDGDVYKKAKKLVQDICNKFPIYKNIN